MSRKRTGFYNTIEYIGPRPEKPKRPNFFGGWVIFLIAIGIGFYFGRPMLPMIKAAQQEVSTEQASLVMAELEDEGGAGNLLAAAALERTFEDVVFDRSYYKISYPGGDIAEGKGAAADVVIRSYRKLGIDLQVEVHEDMAANFREYPQLWGLLGPDKNIDHRRVANLQRFFERNGESLPVTRDGADYEPGDVVIWSLADATAHIGIVVPGPGNRADEDWVVHHMSSGVKWEDVLFDYPVHAHFRYSGEPAE
ncbi:MAG: DUF1287 domain-containing protein [Verrucomicrobiales bacterium]|nr:DUF1287 domain-containing protein [Verrucomicrobiota bacterium JB025]